MDENPGPEFEKLVARKYEALGYSVERNVRILGHQIDAVATRQFPGAPPFKILIEAKYRTETVGINHITDFLNAAKDIINEGMAHTAAIVVDGRVSAEASGRTHANPRYRILQVRDLDDELFNYTESMIRLVSEYEKSDDFVEYIGVSGVATNVLAENPVHVPDIKDEILDWIERPGSNLRILLGDFGAGKTTLLRRVLYEQNLRRQDLSTARIPLFFPLRNLRQYSNAWEFAASCLLEEHLSPPTRGTFFKSLNAGRFVLLLDGLDEANPTATAEERSQYLATLSSLIIAGSPCLISTRPTYFESFDDMSATLRRSLPSGPNFAPLADKTLDVGLFLKRMKLNNPTKLEPGALANRLTISPLSVEDIRQYLNNFADVFQDKIDSSAADVYRFLTSVYDLSDLLTRPLLLKMVVITLLDHGLDVFLHGSETAGPSQIYELYTRSCVLRDAAKAPVSMISKLVVCREMALAMMREKTLEMSAAAVEQAVVRAQPTSVVLDVDETVMEKILTDIRLCTFLTFTSSGSFRFAHKSYQEFFVAQALQPKIRGGHDLESLAELPLTRETIYFLASYARNDALTKANLLATHRLRNHQVSKGLATLCRRIIFGGNMASGLDFDGGELHEVDLARGQLFGTTLRKVEVRRVRISHTKMVNCVLDNCSASSTEIRSVDGIRCRVWLNGDFNLDRTSFDQSWIKFSGQWTTSSSRFSGGAVTLSGHANTSDFALQQCEDVELLADLKLAAESSLSFQFCRVVARTPDDWCGIGSRVKFERCTVVGVSLTRDDLNHMLGVTGTGSPSTFLRGCKGLVVVADDVLETLGDPARQRLSREFPDLVLAKSSFFGRYVATIESDRQTVEWTGGRAATAKALAIEKKRIISACDAMDIPAAVLGEAGMSMT